MNNAEIAKKAYLLARDYLPAKGIPGVKDALVLKYLDPKTISPRPDTLPGLYLRILESAQSANMKAGVIGKAIGGVDKLGPVLSGFDPGKVLSKFGDDSRAVLAEIEARLKPRGKIRKEPKCIWPQYCRTILSAAQFLSQFRTAGEFYGFADFFDKDERARPSLPMLMGYEIQGLGFALARDFLKELGYVNFPKPDVHLRDVFRALDLCPADADQYQLFKAIIRVARNAGVTPYAADKVFWLVCSGFFYNDSGIGKDGKIGGRKKEFIAYAKKSLGMRPTSQEAD